MDFDGNGDLSLPELLADFNYVVNTSEQELVLKNQQDNREIQEAAGNFDILGLGDNMGLPESQAKEIQMQTKISILESREKRLKKRLADALQLVLSSEQTC